MIKENATLYMTEVPLKLCKIVSKIRLDKEHLCWFSLQIRERK